MSYRFLDHTADIALEVNGSTLEQLFESAALGWREAVISLNYEVHDEKRIYQSENTSEELLVNFLDELNYLLYTKNWVFDKIKSIRIEKQNGMWNLNCLLSGSYFSDHSVIKEEIKAITFHQMSILENNDQFTTRIIFDI